MLAEQVAPIDTNTQANPADFFKIVYQSYLQAEQSAGLIERFYNIGDYTVRLCFAGPALVSGTIPAMEHLAIKTRVSPDFTVCLWDSVSTGVQMLPPPWNSDAYIARGEVKGYNNDRFRTAFHLGASILNILDGQQNLAVFWIRDAAQLPYYESGAPLRTILNWWLSNHQRQFVHAAAVGTREGGVLLAGKGGSGKSTTALNCLNSELIYASDDYCLVATDPQPYVYSLYSSAKVNADNTHRIPHLVEAIANADRLESEKALLFLNEYWPEKITTGFPIKAILIPRVTGRQETRFTPTSSIAGLKALAPSTIFQLSGAGQVAFQAITQLVKRIPCYNLELGTNISKIPGVIINLLSDLQ